ncbi:UvrD-helicase domain-containing protein [Planococcus sp. N028]|uniref:DNA 3'-5' helicase n=1 Tax=Planococcus shixiaomingii TaxID=3058393 RepID=A0ABT8N2U0_9BACL|nr:UvrD-helicase domain-containing protein [Planococcus sp. N028]MDN7242208.1 UvrD-helicase domain-containing protein [Planococcus sp. N028]
MYIEGNDSNIAGYKAEKVVLEAIRSSYGDTLIGIHHFPMFGESGENPKEIDILLVDKILGLTAIEVKGINIQQISTISAHNWYYKDFYIDKGNPYEQVKNQMYMLQNYLENDPILYHRFSKRVLVALPYITSEEWASRNFENKISIPPIIFKDDLTHPSMLKDKIKKAAIWENPKPMSDIQWNHLLQKLGVGLNQTILSRNQPFSSLYIINTEQEFLDYKKQIREELKNGIKVYVLSYINLTISMLNIFESNSSDDINSFIHAFQFLYYQSEIQGSRRTDVIYNGASIIDDKNFQNSIANDFPTFDLGQYLAIHADSLSHEIVTAGAGTGKTHVMIDRILFLLIHENIKLSSIDMITFTNESTNEMKDRLEKRFITLYQLTKQPKFLFFAEEVSDMTISTIHKYSKSILKRLAHEIGYGQNLSVSSFITDKKTVIEKLLNSYLVGDKLKDFITCNIPTFELVNTIHFIWNKMEIKGLSSKEILDLDWGKANSKEAIILQDIFTYVFKECEAKLEIIKKKKNAISTGDLIRKLKQFTGNPDILNQLFKNRFVFIDEFQDSDSVQIELFASLANHLNYKLFVVGDLKQSIYRFRGADYKSFKILKKSILSKKVVHISLNQNYRSTAELLNELHLIFEKWGASGLLEYDSETDRLYGTTSSSFAENIYIKEDVFKSVQEALLNVTDDKDKVALIVRTNKQARLAKEICNTKGITTSENLDGTFYTSDAVLHFNTLLKTLLFPNEPKYLIDLLQTPYFGYVIPYQKLIEFNGNKEAISNYLSNATGNIFNAYVRSLKTKSPLAIFHEIVQEHSLFNNLNVFFKEIKNISDENQLNYLTRKYERNLQHLITQIEKTFESKNLELFTIEQWLMIQIKTNRKENEPLLSNTKTQVEITTVHRSKGLQYHTVILPYTDLRFAKFKTDFYFQEEPENEQEVLKSRKIGWQIDKSTKTAEKIFQNNHHKKLLELDMSEMKKEEARLLYVAMTRAINQLYIVRRNKTPENTWSALLKLGGLEK